LWQQHSTGYECCEYEKDAITDSWSASEPFSVREMDHGSTNTSEADHESGDEASLLSSEGVSIPEGASITEGVPIPEGVPIQERVPAPVRVLQRQGRTNRPNPRYFLLRMVKYGMTPDKKMKSWHTKQRFYTTFRLE